MNYEEYIVKHKKIFEPIEELIFVINSINSLEDISERLDDLVLREKIEIFIKEIKHYISKKEIKNVVS